jgi:4-hydroxy-4-methyl-2-oxoglutarate aldolase
MTDNLISELARLGVATVYEAGGRTGMIDLDLHQVVSGSRVAGPARTVRCGQDDNLMVHAVMAAAQPGDVLVLTMPEPAPVALVGELLATQALAQGVAAILIDAAVRDVVELRTLGLPIWARWVRVRGATKTIPGALQVPIAMGGATIRPSDMIVLDADGAVVVAAERTEAVVEAVLAREARENGLRAEFAAGRLSIDVYNLRDAVRAQLAPASQDERSTP